MRAKGPRSLGELLRSGDIGRLATEAAERGRFLSEIRALLPPDEASHLVTASTDDAGALVLGMDTAAWAARVRYRAHELGWKSVRVRVVPRRADR
jgi:hypothetical protein